MPRIPRDYEAELGSVMDALAESVAEASDNDVLQEARENGEDTRSMADRIRGVLKRAASNDERQFLGVQPVKDRLADDLGSDIVPTLEIAFASRSLRELCESAAKADRHFGAGVAQNLRRRLADLRAATTVKDLIAGRPRELEGARRRCFAVDLSESSRLVFCANHRVMPTLRSGDVNWSRIRRVKILRIEHDDA